MKSKEERFLELILGIDINNLVMDYDEYGNKLFWFDKNGKWICEYDLEDGWFWINYDKIWSFFEEEYGLNYAEIQTFIKTMVEQHFKFKDVTPVVWASLSRLAVEQHFKFKDVTPMPWAEAEARAVEQHFKFKDVTPQISYSTPSGMVEQHFKFKDVTPTWVLKWV